MDIVWSSVSGGTAGWVPSQPKPSGFYIWSNNAESTSWSIRWTGGDNDMEFGEGVNGAGIYIGKNYETPKVYASFVEDDQGRRFINQNFEVPAPVPEPATMLLVGMGLIGVAGIGRKKSQKNDQNDSKHPITPSR